VPALTLLLDWRTWLAITIAGLIAVVGIQTMRLNWAKNALTIERAERATERYTAEAMARAMAERNASLQAAHAAKQQEALRAFNDALAEQERRVAAADADAAELRAAVECYTSGDCVSANANPAPGGTCVNRAATLGKLFGRADTTAGRMAKAADKHADEVRALKAQILADRAACGASSD